MFNFIYNIGEDSFAVEASTDVGNADDSDVDSSESHGFYDYYIPDESISEAYATIVIAEGSNEV